MEEITLQPPIEGYAISRSFAQHLGAEWKSRVPGVDYACPVGTPVLAAAAGVVMASRYGDAGGRYLQIRHSDGIQTLYSHLEIVQVLMGEPVAQGQVIAWSGCSGYCKEPHLHFAVKLAGSGWVNPVHQFAPDGP